MESNCTHCNENIYFACRKRAASYNDKLNSRENAAELLGISMSTLANHELGITKSVPVDTVVMMADLYHAPELKNNYCKNECPIGRGLPVATSIDSLEGITIRLLQGLDDETIRMMKKKLIDIAADGEISDDEMLEMKEIFKTLDSIAKTISELRMLAERITDGSDGNGSCK